MDKQSVREGEMDRVPRTTVTIPYIAGVSEEIRRVCLDYDVRVAFKTGRTLCFKLTRVKDPLYHWRNRPW